MAATLRVHPRHGDHRYGGEPVLPAVEAMALLAASAAQAFPRVDCRVMGAARFERFLPLPPAPAGVETFHELTLLPDGAVRAELMTRQQGRNTALSRMRVHAGITFGPAGAPPSRPQIPPAAGGLRFAAERLYRDLVPFGAAFQSVCGTIDLTAEGATAAVRSPGDGPAAQRLGALLVLDGAFHLACAWGQRHGGFVGFPVGFARRRVCRPAAVGEPYQARVSAGRPSTGPVKGYFFDVGVYDAAGGLCEMVEGLDMRDLSRGRIRPPDWVRRPE